MNDATKKLITDVLGLPLQMRALLAEKLLESLDDESDFQLTEEWKQEIGRRCREIDEEKAVLIDSEEVFQKAFGALE